jgi:hypothetical protein
VAGAMMQEMHAALLVLVVACGSPQPPPSANPAPRIDAEQMLSKTAEFRDAMCKCADVGCYQKVMDAMTAWLEETAKSPEPTMTEDETKRWTEIDHQLKECSARLLFNEQI